MAVSVVSSVSAALSATRSPTATFASWTPATNDLVVLFVTSGATGATPTAPATWVNPLGGTTDVESDSHEGMVVYHWVTGAEQTAGTLIYTATNCYSATQSGGTIGVVLRGVDTATPIDALGTTFDSGDTATPHIIAGLLGTDVGTGSLVLGFVCADGQLTYATAPTGWTVVAKNSAAQMGRIVCSCDTLTTAGSNVAAANITPSAGDEYASITLAFTPAAASGGNTTGFFALM